MNLAQVAEFCEALADVTVGSQWGHKTWLANGRGFALEHPLTKADHKRLGDDAPTGDIIAIETGSLDAKDALIALPGFFTTPHVDGYTLVLVQLDAAGVRDVKAALRGAYQSVLAMSPPKKRKPKKKR